MYAETPKYKHSKISYMENQKILENNILAVFMAMAVSERLPLSLKL